MAHRELTPAQHRAIRRQLILIPAYLWAVFAWHKFFAQFFEGGSVPENRDFMHFYTLGLAANAHSARTLYDMDAQEALLSWAVPGVHGVTFPPVYGPQVALLFAPLARLPYNVALNAWMGITILLCAACWWVLWRVSPALKDLRWTAAVLLLGAPAMHSNLGYSQAAAIGLVCVTAAFLALRADRLFLAGLAIGMLVYKPPLGLVAAVVFVGAGEWRIVSGAIASATAQVAAGCLFWGPGILGPYVKALTQVPSLMARLEPLKHDMHSWRSFFDLMGMPEQAALVAYLVMAAATAGLALLCWRSRGPLVLRYSAFLVATVLVDPHLYVYDLVLLIPALLLLWNWAFEMPEQRLGELLPALASRRVGQWSFRNTFQVLLYLCYFAPLFGLLAIHVHVQGSVFAHLALLGVVTLQLRHQATANAENVVGAATTAQDCNRVIAAPASPAVLVLSPERAVLRNTSN